MTGWQPDRARSDADRRALARRLQRAISLLVDAQPPARCAAVADGLGSILQGAATEPPLGLLHPDVFDWYFRLRSAGEERDLAALCGEETLGELQSTVRQSRQRAQQNAAAAGVPLDLDVAGGGVQRALHQATTEANAVRSTPANVHAVEAGQMLPALSAAFRVLGGTWPELHAEITDNLQRLIPFSGTGILSFTSFRYHGSVFLRCEDVGTDPVDLAAEIIHESAHVRLNAALAVSELFHDDGRLLASPLRRDARPPFGVFHQAFVLARQAAWYQRFLDKGQTEYRDRFFESVAKFCSAHDTVANDVAVTSGGKALLDSLTGHRMSLERARC